MAVCEVNSVIFVLEGVAEGKRVIHLSGAGTRSSNWSHLSLVRVTLVGDIVASSEPLAWFSFFRENEDLHSVVVKTV